ncbi:MAG: TIGR00730 family Rossman fold protein [Pirellulales bacterium]|nr:TIGR00730 family Rossman fold protein [Pirellulales bacterium]
MNDEKTRQENLQRILHSRSYVVAYKDIEFLASPELRHARMELEQLKPELTFRAFDIESTIVVFGSTQIVEPAEAQRRLDRARAALTAAPDDPRRRRDVARAERIAAKSQYYDIAREFARLVSSECQAAGRCDYVVITGGGPGIMEAANRGAFDVGAKSIGLNIRLPKEQSPNPYITPELCFQFHYFAIRKLHFLLRAKALVVFPGGFGTFDELFDALTLRQTGRMQEIPVILFGRKYWENAVNFRFLADEGTIDDRDLDLIRFVDTPEEAWRAIRAFHASS